MNKEKLIILIVVILLIVAGGLFWWRDAGERKVEDERELAEYSLGWPLSKEKDFVIEDTPEGKIIKNEKAGMIAEVPEGWIAEKVNVGGDEEINSWIVNTYSSDATFHPETPVFIEEGCGAGILIFHSKEQYNEIKGFIGEVEQKPGLFKELQETEEIELLEVDGKPAVKEVLFESQYGTSIQVKLPFNDRVYIFDTLLTDESEIQCSQEFSDFLEKVSIKNL